MLDDPSPGNVVARECLERSDDVGEQERRGAGAVAADRADIAAEGCVQKAVQLALT